MAFIEKDVQEKVYKALAAANEKAVALLKKQREWEAELTGDRYKREYVQGKIDSYKADIKGIREAVAAEVREMLAEYREVAADAESLHAEDITADAALLEHGLVRSPREMEKLFEKYADNYTMHRLLNDYAKAHKFAAHGFVPRGMTVADVDSLESAVNRYILHWVGTDHGENVINRSFGYEPGSKEESGEDGNETGE